MAIVICTIVIVAITIAIGLLVDRKVHVLPRPGHFQDPRERERKQRITHAAGEAPGTALRVRDTQIDKLRTSQRCPACSADMRNDADDHVRYNDTDLLVLHFTCTSCAAKRSLYVDRVDR